jgi:hypothetical protein
MEEETLEVVSFQDLLMNYAEERPELGRPLYNYRPVIGEGGEVQHKAQVVMGGYSKVGGIQSNQTEAAEMAAKEMFMFLHPNASEILEKMKRYTEKVHARKKVKDSQDVYYSDEEKNFPSYEKLLRDLLISHGAGSPQFTYNTGEAGGYLCSGTVFLKELNQKKTMVSLREHSRKDTAREDVSHDLYVLVRSFASVNKP